MADTQALDEQTRRDLAPGPAGSAAELSRLRAEAAFHQRLRDLTVAFSRAISSSFSLPAALRTLAFDANSLLGARRTSVWLHRRRQRDLTLAASSDAAHAESAVPVAADDPAAPPARGLRLDRPAVIANGEDFLLLAPLRGWRRALGTLVVEGPFTEELEGAQLVELTYELGRQLSAAIENVQLLEEILRQRRLLEDTFNSLADLVVVTDSAHRIVQTNDAFAARIGVSRAELLDRPLDSLVGNHMAAWIASVEAGTAEGAGAATLQRFEDERLGGTFAVTMTALISEGGDPAGRVLVVRDITHQTRLEREREALRERLAQTEKLASLGQFVAGIAHEMNNPLQGVLGHLELLMETSAEAAPLKRDLRRIFQEADRAAKIVRNLLVFTGSRRMVRRRLRMERVLARVLSVRAAALKRAGIQVLREDPADLPAIVGDPLLLHQAFLNIVMNAEHAIGGVGPEGRLEVRTRTDAPGDRVIVTVRDTGGGIPEAVLPRIFDPFFTTKDVGAGTGLGLAITYGIVQDHDGVIVAANHPEGGAVFTVELPAAPPKTD